MKKLLVFTLVLVAALLLLAVVAAWYIFYFQAGNASMYNMMGQMMGNQYAVPNPMPNSVWFSVVVLFIGLAAGVIGVAYYSVYPEIRRSREANNKVIQPHPDAPKVTSPLATKESWLTLMRTSKPDEKRVLEVLSAHDGVYLQKLIVKEAGLSKLKTHRIISRLAERGIVSASKTGNTNEVKLSPWLNRNEKSSETM